MTDKHNSFSVFVCVCVCNAHRGIFLLEEKTDNTHPHRKKLTNAVKFLWLNLKLLKYGIHLTAGYKQGNS